MLVGQVVITPVYTVKKFENGTGDGPLGRSGGVTFRFISTGGPFDSCAHWGFVAGNNGDTKMNLNNFVGPPTNSCSYTSNEYFTVNSGVNTATLNLTASSEVYCKGTGTAFYTTNLNTRATVSTNTGTIFNVGNFYLLKISGLDSFEITVEYEAYSPSGRAYIGSSTANTWQPAVSLFDNLHTSTVRSICTEFESRLYAYSNLANAALSGGQATACSGDTVGTLTATATGGSGVFSYQWFANGTLVAGETTNTFNPQNIQVATDYYCIIWDSCAAYTGYVASDTTDTLAVTLDPNSITAGYTTPNQFLCPEETPALTTLTGFANGTVQKWQWATDSIFTTPNDITLTTTTATGTNVETAFGGPLTGTIWLRCILDNASCPETNSLPNKIVINEPNVVTFVDDSATCQVSGNMGWHHFYRDSTGKIIASINSNSQNLGSTVVKVFQHNGRSTYASTPGNCLPTFAVMSRSFVIQSDSTFPNPVSLRLYFTDNELGELIDSSLETQSTLGSLNWPTNDPAPSCQINDDVRNIGDVVVTQVSGASAENEVFDPTDGNFRLHLPSNSGIGNATFDANYVEFSVDNFSEFWLHGSQNGTALPVGLLDFKAKDIGNNFIQLNWTTTDEVNSSHFDLFRRVGEKDSYELVHTQESSKSGNSVNDYEYIDEISTNTSTNIYYKLRQVDLNGDENYSSVIVIQKKPDEDKVISLHPNPAQNNFSIGIENYIPKFHYQIYDLTGKIIVEGTTRSNENIEVKQLNSGSYMILVKLGNRFRYLKLSIH